MTLTTTRRAKRGRRLALAVVAAAVTAGSGAALAAGTIPRNTQLPVVTGTNLVGQTLSATDGSWSGQPTSYDVWWMRCAPTGNPCQNIPNSFGSTYTITPADAGHAIEVGVVATNDAGSSFTAASAPTETISSIPTTRFDLRGITGAPEFAYWIVRSAGRPRAGDWAHPSGLTVTPGQADIGVRPGQTVYFSPTAEVGKRFGASRTMDPSGPSGTAVRVSRTGGTIRVRLPGAGRAYRPGLSHGELWVLGQLNRKRHASGEPPLRVSRILDEAASVAARDEAVHGRFPDPFLFVIPQSFGWPGDLANSAVTIIDAPLRTPAAVLAHWDGATSGESSGLWSEIRDPFMSLVGIADGNGAWNLILTPGCPESLGPMLACGATNITGM